MPSPVCYGDLRYFHSSIACKNTFNCPLFACSEVAGAAGFTMCSFPDPYPSHDALLPFKGLSFFHVHLQFCRSKCSCQKRIPLWVLIIFRVRSRKVISIVAGLKASKINTYTNSYFLTMKSLLCTRICSLTLSWMAMPFGDHSCNYSLPFGPYKQ